MEGAAEREEWVPRDVQAERRDARVLQATDRMDQASVQKATYAYKAFTDFDPTTFQLKAYYWIVPLLNTHENMILFDATKGVRVPSAVVHVIAQPGAGKTLLALAAMRHVLFMNGLFII